MLPLRRLMQSLATLATPERYLFALDDLRVLLPELSASAFKTLLIRAVKQGCWDRVCRGLYL